MARRATGLWVYAGDGGVVIPPPPPVFTARPVVAFGHYLVRVGRPDGLIIGEMRGSLESASWQTDGYGMATMVVPAAEVAAMPQLFQFGNRVRIDFDSGLRPWIGVIDPPRESMSATVRVEMYEAAYMLSWRVTDELSAATSYEGVTGAALVDDLIVRSGLPLWVGDYGGLGGPVIDIAFDRENVLSALARLREMDEGLHYDTVDYLGASSPSIQPALRLWRGARADDSSRVILRAGYNLANATMLEQGPIVNQVIVETKVPDVLQGAGGNAAEPVHGPVFVGNHAASQGAHDLRQMFVAQPDVDTQIAPNAGQQYADARVAEMALPRRRVSGSSVNMEPGLWRDFSTGSRVRLEIYRPTPLALTAVVNGMEYTPGAGTLALVLSDAVPAE